MTQATPDPARWSEVKSRFEALAGLDDAKREELLAGIRATDPDLAREVEALLRHATATTGDLLPAAHVGGALLGHAPGDHVGPWRLIRVLGEGGMGVVFEACRADGAFEQRVAIKLVNGAWRPALRERLAAERRILATLDHPAIARLIDGGTTPAGNPYLVMELVEGTPITRHAADASLPLTRRLGLVCAALDAVQSAHEQLVVHRDIKPSNVLVSGDGRVKLLDFGIAKVLAQEAEAPVEATRIFTPGYASPEQVRGEPPSAAGDVYAMGVLLYELVTGSHPYAADSGDAARWLDALLTRDPEPAARRIKRLRPGAERLSPELDAIIARALARDPRERYRTARELAEDLRAFLAHRPVGARPAGPLERARKFVRRNPVGTSLATLAIAAVCASSVAAVLSAHRAEAARADSERRFNEVRRLANDVIFAYQDALEPLGGQALDVRLKLALDGRDYLDALTASPNVNDALLREAATAYRRIGDLLGDLSQANLGRSAGALESYQRARMLHAALLERHPGNAHDSAGLVAALHAIGRMHLTSGQLDAARASFAEAERALAGSAAVDARQRLLLRLDAAAVQSCSSFGYRGDSADAMARVLRLREDFAALLKPARTRAALEANVSWLLAAGALHGCIGHVPEAVAAFEQAEALTAELRDAQPYNVAVLHRRAMILLELGYWRAIGGQPAAGLARMEEARDILESLYESHKRDAKLRVDLATTYNKLGGLHLRMGSLEAAERGARRAETILQTLLAEAPSSRTYHTLLAAAYNRQAQTAHARLRHAEALRLTQLALQHLRGGEGGNTAQKTHVATVLNYRAQIEDALGDAEGAAASRLESVALAREAAVENPAAMEPRITLARSLVGLAERANPLSLRHRGLDAAAIAREAVETLRELERGGALPPSEHGLLRRAQAAWARLNKRR